MSADQDGAGDPARRPRPGPGGAAPNCPRPGPASRPRPEPHPGPRTAARRERAGRAATVVALLIVIAGAGAAALVVIMHRKATSSAAAAASASIAPPPSFGASLPISSPAAASSSAGTAALADAQLGRPGAVASLLTAATDAVQTVDSYDYRHLQRDRAAGDAASTGTFRARYDGALLGGVGKAARAARTVQQAVVQKIAVTSLSADGAHAGVLAFGRLDVTDTAHPESTTLVLASGVRLDRIGGRWRISDMTDLGDSGDFVAAPPGNAALLAAVTAGAREVVNLLSYSRADFDADFNRALDGLTGVLRAQQAQQRSGLLQSMNDAQSDYAGTVRAVGVESASGSSVLLLVCATGYRVSAVSSSAAPAQLSGTERFEVGVEYVHGRWLVSEYLALPGG